MANLRSGTYGNYYGSYTGESEPLTKTEMEVNALYVYSYLIAAGWTPQSIAALLGNMQAESTINPGRWQSEDVGNTSMGYSLVQWTPATKYIEWCTDQGYSDPSEMDNALSRILYELNNGIQWIATSAYNMSFSEFAHSLSAPSTLAVAFLLNYERPADQSATVQAYRGSLADAWYTYITGEEPTPGGGGGSTTTRKKKKGYNFVLFGRKPWRNPT